MASHPLLLHLGAVCGSGGGITPAGSLRSHGSREEEGGPDSRLGLCRDRATEGGEGEGRMGDGMFSTQASQDSVSVETRLDATSHFNLF